MVFTPKDWQDTPSTSTPISAAALEDMETRLAAYSEIAGGASLLGVDPTLATYGADKTGAVDCTTALRNATTAAVAANLPVTLPPGTYTVSGRIHSAGVTANAVKYVAAVPGTVTIQRTANIMIIETAGTRGTSVALSANVAVGATSVTTASLPSGLVAEDYAEIESDTIFSGIANTAEVRKIRSITGTGPYTINFYGRLEEAYTTAAAGRIRKLNFVAPSTLHGITFKQTATNRDTADQPLVRMTLTRGDHVERCTFRDADAPGIEMVSAIDWTIDTCRFDNLTDDIPNNRIGYGINCGDNSFNGYVHNCSASKVRHAFTSNGNSVTPHGCPRHITVHFRMVQNTTSAALDTHDEGKHITFINPHIVDCGGQVDNLSFTARAPFTTLLNPTIAGVSGPLYLKIPAHNSRVIGGEIVQTGATSMVTVEANNCSLIGTKITCLGGGSTTPISITGNDSRLVNIDSDLGTGTGTHIAYAAASVRNILDGGVFLATATRVIASLGAGATLGVMEPPYRYLNADGTQLWSGTPSAVTYFESGYVAPAGSHTMLNTERLIAMDSSGGARTLQLPAATNVPKGQFITIKDKTGQAATGNLTVNRAGSDTFDDATTSKVINVGFGQLTIYSDGATKWHVVSYAGSTRSGYVASASSYTMQPSDRLVEITDLGIARTAQLPTLSTVPVGLIITVKDGSGNAGTNNLTVQRAGSDTFEDGATTKVISTNYDKLSFYSNGTKWMLVE